MTNRISMDSIHNNELNIKMRGRILMEECYMQFAFILSERSTCIRNKIGCVITSNNMERVLGIGYNGNYKGGKNSCDSEREGSCGCIHAEINALVKAGSIEKDKKMFCTTSPCYSCAKLIINSGFSHVYYSVPYRSFFAPTKLLARSGIKVIRIKPQKFSNELFKNKEFCKVVKK